MTTQVRSLLLGIVVLNLVFVRITGAVSASWMIPLFALTLAAPLLAPLQKHLSYRIAWNVGLMAMFAMLLMHISSVGVRFMLEDGLMLAAFCQVHVLNNLSRQKRPDLIFFNSFLIALVTGFFCQDLAFSLVFAVYAMVLILTISLSAASPRGPAGSIPKPLPPERFWPVVRRSLRMGAVTLGVTGVVFAFWPRNFEREGFVKNELVAGGTQSQVGFADEVQLENKGAAVLSDRVVLRAKLLRGSQEHVSKYWRGATFTNLRRRGWVSDTNQQGQGYATNRQLDEVWERKSAGHFERPGHRLGATLAVTLTGRNPKALFAPLAVHGIRFDCAASPNLDGIFRVSFARRTPVEYELDCTDRTEAPREGIRGFMRDLLMLRSYAIPAEIDGLLREVKQRIPEDATIPQRVAIVRDFVARGWEYFLPGETGAAPGLRAFLRREGGGHCEYFATTMVILLRKLEIPCRMVGGYHAHEWNEAGNELVIRSKHAHAWVEVWEEARGFVTYDPTPPRETYTESEGSAAAIAGYLRDLWSRVTKFDAKDRAAALAWAGEKLRELAKHPIAIATVLLGLFLLRRWWRRRQPRRPPPVEDYLGVLRKLGLVLESGETPRGLLARVRANLPPERVELLERATEAHEIARYG